MIKNDKVQHTENVRKSLSNLPIIDIYGKCRTMNPSTNTSTTSTGNIQGWSQKKQTKTFEVFG